MRSRSVARWAGRVLMLAGLCLHAPLTAGQEPPSARFQLTADARSRLLEGARDSKIAPWQRQFMLDVACGGTEAGAVDPSQKLPALALPLAATDANDGAWTTNPMPSSREGHTAIYDPVRNRMVVFGGHLTFQRDDVWALSLSLTGSAAWSELSPAGTPPAPRDGHTAIYDPVRDRMVVFGGFDGNGYLNDVWALSLTGSTSWSRIACGGTLPSPRGRHTAIYDPVRDRMVVFAGADTATLYNEVWALPLAGSATWSELVLAGTPPSPRLGHSASYDPSRDRMVVFGGSDTTAFNNDVWALSFAGSAGWSELAPTGTLPSPREGHSAIYDAARDRMVMFGGYDDNGERVDVWALSFSGSVAWSSLAIVGTQPSPRFRHTAIYDPVRDRMVVFGGGGNHLLRDLVWGLSLTGSAAWSTLPAGKSSHTAIYDSVRDRMVIFGGHDGSGTRNDVWALSLSGSATWSEITPVGTRPPPRFGHTAIHDPVRDRMVVFGGYDGSAYRNDAWVLSLAGSAAWSEITPTGTPPTPRQGHSAIYDSVRDRMVVFGGFDGSPRNDGWALSLAGRAAWSSLAPTGVLPVGRFLHTAIFDPVRDRMVVFGGFYLGLRNDVWALSLAGSTGWTELAPAGTLPPVRAQHAAIYDPVRDRMVVFGGAEGSPPNDVWALSLAGSATWSELSPAGVPQPSRRGHTAIYDPLRDRMVVFGGESDRFRNDLSSLWWDPTVSVPGARILPRFALAPPRPNPSRGATTVAFELEGPARVALDVFDAQGRRVKRIADARFTAGRHASVWGGDDDAGHALRAGVYFIRMQVNGEQATRRTVRVH